MESSRSEVRQVNRHRQVVIPKRLADSIGLAPGGFARVSLAEDAIEIRPAQLDIPYSASDLQAIHRLFEAPANRGRKLNAHRFKKHLERL